MLIEPGLNTLQRKELADLLEVALQPLRERITELEEKVGSLEDKQSWYVIKDSELWRF